MSVGPNILIGPGDGAMLLAALDRLDRKVEKLDEDNDRIKDMIRELELKLLHKEAANAKARIKMMTGIAMAGGIGGTGLAKLLALFGM